MIAAQSRRRRMRKAALAHRCPSCLQPWALKLAMTPAGRIVVCRYCETERVWWPLLQQQRHS
jgi:hypothetical protein